MDPERDVLSTQKLFGKSMDSGIVWKSGLQYKFSKSACWLSYHRKAIYWQRSYMGSWNEDPVSFPTVIFFSPQLIYYRYFSPDLLHSDQGKKSRHNLLASAWWKQNCIIHIFPLSLFFFFYYYLPVTQSARDDKWYLVSDPKITEEGFPSLELSCVILWKFLLILNSK